MQALLNRVPAKVRKFVYGVVAFSGAVIIAWKASFPYPEWLDNVAVFCASLAGILASANTDTDA